MLSSLSDFNLQEILVKILHALILTPNRSGGPVQFIRIIEYFRLKNTNYEAPYYEMFSRSSYFFSEIPVHDIWAHKLRLQAQKLYHEWKKNTKSREFI